MTCLSTLIKKVDFMAPPVTLTMGGEKGVKTIFSAFLSLVYIAIFVLSSYMIMIANSSTQNASVVQQVSKDNRFSRQKLGNTNLLSDI
jgi:hypothetical protein